MKKRVIIIGGVVAAACLLGAGAWHFLKGKGKSSENVAYVTTVGSLTGEDVSGTRALWNRRKPWKSSWIPAERSSS